MKQLNDLKSLQYENTYGSTDFTSLIENTAVLLRVIPSVVSSTLQGQLKAPVTLLIICSYIQTCTLCSGLISCGKQDCFINLNSKTRKAIEC